jgi:hypothetical protein
MQSRFLKVYVGMVVAIAALSLLALPAADVPARPRMTVLMIVLAALLGTRRVRFPALRTHLTATDAIILCALAAFGPVPAVLTALGGVVGAAFGSRHRPALIKFVFNVGAHILSTAACAGAFLLAGGAPGQSLQLNLWPLSVGTVAYFLISTGLVAGAITLENRSGFLATWRGSFQWTAVTYLTSLTLAACLLLMFEHLGPWAVALAVPPCWLLIAFFRSNRERLAEKERRLEEVEKLNADLERTVGELQEALTHVKQLKGLLPICMHCNKIRDDNDNWHKIESYVAEHSEASFTHSLCQDCRTKHYPTARRREAS